LRAYEKKTILDEVVFTLFLSYITVTCRHTIVFSRQRLLLIHQNVSICVLFILIIWYNIFSGARLRRCLISSKTDEISRAKFHEIQKTNNAHGVTMTSNTYRFCWKQVLTSKV
jgi:hypothetical protein